MMMTSPKGVSGAVGARRFAPLTGLADTGQRLRLAPYLVVAIGGLNLVLIQWVLVRELTTLLLGTELIVLLVSVAYFVGLSVGYGLAERIRPTWFVPLGTLTLILHLTLPIWFRLLAIGLDSLRAGALAYVILPLLVPFVVSAFYSIFLPAFADSGRGSLPVLYAIELLGSASGVIGLVVLGGLGLQPVYSVYLTGILVITWLLGAPLRWILALAAAGIVWLIALPAINGWSNARWYEALHGLPAGTITLFTGYSPYQKVDVLETASGERYLYLDGLNHFGTADGSRLNVIMGQVPASLVRPENALVFGAGSMQMEALIADYGGQVTTVEIDPLVVEASRRYFLSYNRMDTLPNRSVVIDDAKHFIANATTGYDLIATDLPAAYSMQTASLYSEPFFGAVAAHLNPGGVFVVNLTSSFEPDDLVSRRIAAGLLAHFEQVIVVTPASAGWSFAYAGDDLPFDREALETALRATGEIQFALFETSAVRVLVGAARPITLDTLDIALHVSADWIADRLR